MRLDKILILTMLILAGCAKSEKAAVQDWTPVLPKAELPDLPCAVEPRDEQFDPFIGSFRSEKNLMITNYVWPNESPEEPKIEVRIPTLMAKYFPEESPFTPVIIPLGRGRCNGAIIKKGQSISLESGQKIRFDLQPKDGHLHMDLVEVFESSERILESADMSQLTYSQEQLANNQIVAPVVNRFIELKSDRPKEPGKYDHFVSLAKEGRVSALRGWLAKKSPDQQEINQAAQEAVSQGFLSVVRVLLPLVDSETRDSLHCSLNPGFSMRGYSKAFDPGRMVPANLQNTDILNLLLESGNSFGSCGRSDGRDRILASIGDSYSMFLLRRIPGIAQEINHEGQSIFWLIFQNPSLCRSGYKLGAFLKSIGYIDQLRRNEKAESVTRPERFNEYLLLTAAAGFCDGETYRDIVRAVDTDAKMKDRVQKELMRSIEADNKILKEERSLAIRYYIRQKREVLKLNLEQVL
ncbi:MAG: hypothetical protein AB7F86_10905 [Bdellovibrionales bacterium]